MRTIMITGGGCYGLTVANNLAEQGIHAEIIPPEKAAVIAPRPTVIEIKIERLPELTPIWFEGNSNNRADRRKRARQNKRK